jgi:hypothetical protein
MFAVKNVATNSHNIIMEYKGFTISLAFDNGFNNKDGYLSRTEMLISKGAKTVTHHFFDHLNNVVDEGDAPGGTVSGVTLDMLADVKAMIDNGVGETKEEPAKTPFVTVYQSIGGWKSVLMSWEEDMNCYTPWQTGHFGYADKKRAEDDARDWADAEEIELKL